ncbi:MAG: hypothetical protein ACXVAN_09690 [Polyangia bacterium]
MRASSALALAILLAGCFTPDLGDGALACGTNGACPPRYYCHADQRCYKTPDASGGGDMADTFDFAGGDFAACMKVTCGAQSCGVIPDNCGSTIDCGNLCSMGKSCGGGGTPHQCGCVTQVACGNRNCGTMPDGCGGVQSCGGACPSGQTCGGGGAGSRMANVCSGGPTCTVKTCTAGKDCGLISDGCAAVLDCGMCPANKSCGTDHMCH